MKCKGWKLSLVDNFYKFRNASGEFYKYIPNEVMNWAELDTIEGKYNRGSLVKDNDIREKSFLEIADIIEKNF